jgi:hypothetical protein
MQLSFLGDSTPEMNDFLSHTGAIFDLAPRVARIIKESGRPMAWNVADFTP